MIVGFLSPDEIIEDVLARGVLNDSEKEELKNLSEDDLILLHHSLGRFIRNRYELWNENNPYTLKDYVPDLHDDGGITIDINPKHPDSVSHQIVRDLWVRLRGAGKASVSKKESQLSTHRKMLKNL